MADTGETKKSRKKAKSLEKKGDRLLKKDKYQDAVASYEKSFELDPENKEVYGKLIDTHAKIAEDWTLDDFTKEISWTMQRQEIEDPRMSRIHETLAPEFKEITELIYQLIEATDHESEEAVVDKLIAFETRALIPLIEFLRALKRDKK